MTIANVLELSTTDASNVDFKGVGIQGSSSLANGDDAMRALAAIIAAAVTRRVSKSSGATAAKTDHGQLWDFSAAATLALTAAATLTTGWALYVKATGGSVTIDPNGSETIDGSTTKILTVGQSCLIICDGSNFYSVANTGDAPYPTNHLSGLTLTNNGSDATNDIDIAAGTARDSTDVANLVLASALTKQLDAGWAVGTNQGGLDTGAVGNSTYYVWLIRRPDTGVVDALFSLSSTAPTMPANYTQKALIGKFVRSSAVNKAPRSYSQKEGTDWVAYTPTFTGWGTVSSVSFFSRRVGDTLHIRGRWQAGTTTATEARVTLGWNGTDGNIVSDSTKVPATSIAGTAIRTATGAAAFYMLIEQSVAYMTFGLQDASNGALNTKQNGSAIALSGQVWSLTAEVPVAGW